MDKTLLKIGSKIEFISISNRRVIQGIILSMHENNNEIIYFIS